MGEILNLQFGPILTSAVQAQVAMQVEGLIPGFSNLHVKVSLDKISP